MNLCEYLRASKRALIFSGAGISTGSGIPDFRGPQGVWTRRQPVYYQDFMASEAARIEHWDYKLEAWESFRKAQPNDVHRAIVRLEQAEKLRMVVTQNIDGLHSLAGTSPGAAGRAARQQLARRMPELQKAERSGAAFRFFSGPTDAAALCLRRISETGDDQLRPKSRPERIGTRSPKCDGSGPGRGARLHPLGLPRSFVSFARGAARNSLCHHQSRSDGTRRRGGRVAAAGRRGKRNFSGGGCSGVIVVKTHR